MRYGVRSVDIGFCIKRGRIGELKMKFTVIISKAEITPTTRRLARLRVSIRGKTAYVQTSNVYAFSMNGRSNDFNSLDVNGISIPDSDFAGEELEDRKRFELRGTEFSVSPGRDCDVMTLIAF